MFPEFKSDASAKIAFYKFRVVLQIIFTKSELIFSFSEFLTCFIHSSIITWETTLFGVSKVGKFPNLRGAFPKFIMYSRKIKYKINTKLLELSEELTQLILDKYLKWFVEKNDLNWMNLAMRYPCVIKQVY